MYLDNPLGFPLLGDYTFAESPRSIAKAWLNNCIRNHASCRKHESADENWLPTRLVEISWEDDTIGNVRLVTTTNEFSIAASSVQYATLSHCWGTKTFFRLKRSNLDALHAAIPLANLPRTFQEAFYLCGSLGIRYIWIDSLCIVQDDVQDWQSESIQMDQIYANGIINIAAGASEDSSEGLFRQRSGSSALQCPLVVSTEGMWPPEQHEGIADFIKRAKRDEGTLFERCYFVSKDDWQRSVHQSTLARRGWVLQERLLSPRILTFGTRQIYWQCGETSCNEEGSPTDDDYTLKMQFATMLSGTSDWDWEDSLSASSLDIWRSVVTDYSQTRLTKHTDRLVALSGLAKTFCRAMPHNQYLAGMWKDSLPNDLLWEVCYVEGPATSPPPCAGPESRGYCAPTFCWASAAFPCTLNLQFCFGGWLSFGLLFTVLDITLDYATKEVTGPVTGGCLDIMAKLRPFRLVSPSNFDAGRIPKKKLCPGLLNAFSPPEPGRSELGEFSWPLVRLDRPLQVPSPSDEILFFFVVGIPVKLEGFGPNELAECIESFPEFEVGEWKILLAKCMILEAVDADAGVYRRVGMATSYELFRKNADHEKDGLQDLVHFLLKNEPYQGEPDTPIPCRGMDGEEHVFRII